MPPSGGQRTVFEVPGDHSLKAGIDEVRAAVDHWLTTLLDG